MVDINTITLRMAVGDDWVDLHLTTAEFELPHALLFERFISPAVEVLRGMVSARVAANDG